MNQVVGTVADLEASAMRRTGLSDFGGQDYRDGLDVLLESYRTDERLTELGSRTKRMELRGALMARLVAEAGVAARPSVTDIAIEQPIFVTGLPRTGTTALHRLLAADPAHQGLEQWLCEVPQPRPARSTWDDDPVFCALRDGYAAYHAQNPELAGIHYLDAGTVEECWQLLRQSVMSVSYESLAHLPGYSSWLAGQDWTPAYRRHRRNLQLIGADDTDRRWVLKNPSHLFALDALLAVYPDALVVQTHRDPCVAVASACSLSEVATRGHSERFVGATIGRDQLELLARGATTFRAERARHDPTRFLDVHYDDLVRDPVGTAEAVYRHFDLPWTAAAREAMQTEDAESRSGPRTPRHRYSLADFGLEADEVRERFV